MGLQVGMAGQGSHSRRVHGSTVSTNYGTQTCGGTWSPVCAAVAAMKHWHSRWRCHSAHPAPHASTTCTLYRTGAVRYTRVYFGC